MIKKTRLIQEYGAELIKFDGDSHLDIGERVIVNDREYQIAGAVTNFDVGVRTYRTIEIR